MTGGNLQRVVVLGAGAWGTALANSAARAGRDVALWGRDHDAMRALARERENARYLPGVPLAASVTPTSDLDALRGADIVLTVTPAQAHRQTAAMIAPLLRAGVPVVICAKGIERDTHLFMSDVIRAGLPRNPPAVLSGPSFAADVSRGLPTAVTIAADDMALAEALGHALSTTTFRLYHSDDLRGVEIGGAAKNVLAIACGVAQGRGLGASAVAALVARGFAELSRFGRAFGARSETLMGLSGLGDLVLTCGSTQSRNFAFGRDLGAGKSLREAGGGKLAEGAFTARALVEMAAAKGVETPIAAAIDAVLAGRLDVDGAIDALLARPRRSEG